MKKIKYSAGLVLIFFLSYGASAQGQPAPDAPAASKNLLLSVTYVNSNNRLQYLKATAKA